MSYASPKLYPRMALYIGAALAAFVLLGAIAFASIAAWELSNYVETRGSELGREAARVLSSGGTAALETWLMNEAHIPDDVSVFVLDSESNDLFGRPIPEIYADLIATSVVVAPEPPGSAFQPVQLAPRILAPDGTAYAFLVVPRDITLWGSLATAVALIAAAVLVIATVAWFIAGTIGRPVAELQQAVRNLAAGDISARVPARLAKRRDELGQLAGDFNYMADQLTQLIEGREQLMRELSHELRSPLARLQAALALAAARNRLDDKERARVDTEIGLMNKVIGEILRYSSLDTPLRMKTRLVRIDRLLRHLVEVEEVEATGKRCKLLLKTAPDLTVAGDPELLRSAFENILRNAIRYAPPDTAIELTGWREKTGDAETVCVSIRDYGPGIPEDQLKRVFEPYVRASDDTGGSGLGLAIVSRVMERHAGSVKAERCADRGVRLTCRIPAADFS